ncbi:unnamed protein product [Clonostachys rosea f. rosea IK726]|uniref:ATP synthase subunit 5, mitochondrial n=2 Tax=Bionectria ochroleuca TaxID=29856 RepID=A0A0B7JTJ2_BIOOC|nr:unnamed protein product [Clonostachys rosea f. rosea IK726]
MFSRQALRSVRAAAPQRALALRSTPVRSFAAAASADVKPPKAVFGLDGTYATALYTAASKSSALDPTANAITKLGALLEKDPKLASILSAPTLTTQDKSDIVAELTKQAGASDPTFSELIAAARGEVELKITSAQGLDNRTLNRLSNAISKSAYVGPGKTLKVTNSVNPEIVGGLVVEIGDRTIDLSVAARIAKMNKLLTDSL